jgi:transcriptional regulator with XRE-family HTH domain
MKANTRTLGDVIRDQRKLARLSLRELSAMTRVSNAYLSQVERGLHEPSLRVLTAVADALGVPLESMVPISQSETSKDGVPPFEVAVRADPWLNPEEKTALLTIYRSMIDRSDSADAPEARSQ